MKCLAKYIGKNILYGLISIIIITCFYHYSYASEQPVTLDSISDGLSTNEAAFTNLRLEYILQWRLRLEDGSDVFHRIEAVYAKKTPGNLQYLEQNFSRINVASGEVNVFTDGWASFDGNATYTLNKNVRAGKPKRGFVRLGYDPNDFSTTSIYFIPHSNIWNQGRQSLATFIRKNKETLKVEQGMESIEGVPSIKLAGNFAEGKLMMKLWISPQRNFLPIKRQVYNTKDGKLMSETVLSNLVQLPNGLWFPKSIRFGSPDPEWAIYQEITNISIEPIPEDFFKPAFPEGTEVVDEVLGLRYEK